VAVTGVRPPAARQLGILTSPTALEITGVLPSSPADRAGLRAGDIVRSIDSVPVAHPEDLGRLLHPRPAENRFVVEVERAGRPLRAHVMLGPEPAGASHRPGSNVR
jgi:S1-C subfamily serine protease